MSRDTAEVRVINDWLVERMGLSAANDQEMYVALREAARQRIDDEADEEDLWVFAGEGINDQLREWIEVHVVWSELKILILDTLGLDREVGVGLAKRLFDGVADLTGTD